MVISHVSGFSLMIRRRTRHRMENNNEIFRGEIPSSWQHDFLLFSSSYNSRFLRGDSYEFFEH